MIAYADAYTIRSDTAPMKVPRLPKWRLGAFEKCHSCTHISTVFNPSSWVNIANLPVRPDTSGKTNVEEADLFFDSQKCLIVC